MVAVMPQLSATQLTNAFFGGILTDCIGICGTIPINGIVAKNGGLGLNQGTLIGTLEGTSVGDRDKTEPD